jgi:hypothetical protein
MACPMAEYGPTTARFGRPDPTRLDGDSRRAIGDRVAGIRAGLDMTNDMHAAPLTALYSINISVTRHQVFGSQVVSLNAITRQISRKAIQNN